MQWYINKGGHRVYGNIAIKMEWWKRNKIMGQCFKLGMTIVWLSKN